MTWHVWFLSYAHCPWSVPMLKLDSACREIINETDLCIITSLCIGSDWQPNQKQHELNRVEIQTWNCTHFIPTNDESPATQGNVFLLEAISPPLPAPDIHTQNVHLVTGPAQSCWGWSGWDVYLVALVTFDDSLAVWSVFEVSLFVSNDVHVQCVQVQVLVMNLNSWSIITYHRLLSPYIHIHIHILYTRPITYTQKYIIIEVVSASPAHVTDSQHPNCSGCGWGYRL